MIGRFAGTVSSSGRVGAAQDAAVGELPEQPLDGIVEAQDAFLDEDHRRGGDDGLRHRGDPEDAVALHRRAPDREASDHIDVHLAAAGHQRDQAGHVAGFDVPGQHLAQPPQPRRGQTRCAHGRSFSS